MKILHWYPNLLRGGAVANGVLGLSHSQAKLGADVVIATASTTTEPLYYSIERPKDVELFEWHPRWFINFQGRGLRILSRNTIKKLRSFEPEIVHVHGEFNIDNLHACRIFHCPVVLSPRGAFAPRLLKRGVGLWGGKYAYLKLAKKILYEKVVAFHGLSPLEKVQIEELLPTSHVYCAAQGPNLQLEKYLIPGVREESFDAIQLICVGRLDVYTKGLDYLVQAFAYAVKRMQGKRLCLRLIGPDCRGGKEHLKRLARSLGVLGQITFEGVVIGKELIQALKASDIYVQMSRYDGFGQSVCEALLMNKPAILSREIGCISYADIEDMSHIRKVHLNGGEAGDAIIDFAGRLNELNSLAKFHSSQLKTIFSWESAAQAHLNAYAQFSGSRLPAYSN
ncbi:MAG TPA: glycosyltransferase [Nitrospirales bacterium]|nr:hypothetical protein [Nitrospiraceae bacterium]HNP60675.1 glycosyltransferase [Nitrospirales bacterium]